MKHRNKIRRFTAAIFLLLFSFSVTPKKCLHDWFANHRDSKSLKNLPVEQVTPSGFHCHIEDLVVVAPFLPGIQNTTPVFLPSAPVRFAEPLSSFIYAFISHHEGRGPPAASFSWR